MADYEIGSGEPIEVVKNTSTKKSNNNGGSTDYYKIPSNAKDLQDIIELRNLNFAQGNILKAAWCFNIGRHESTTYERELNKIIWFCQRELNRIDNESI